MPNKIPFDRLVSKTIENKSIPKYIAEHYLSECDGFRKMPNNLEWITREGKWTKRMSKYDETSAQFYGSFLGKYIIPKTTFYFDFVRNADWTPGSFGEKKDSCWWNSYNSSRLGLIENGGFAIRFFSSRQQYKKYSGREGIGRAWLYPYRRHLLMFNPYGYEMPVISVLLSYYLEEEFDVIGLEIENTFINSNQASIFGDVPFPTDVYVSDIRLPFWGYCEHCGDKIQRHDDANYLDNKASCTSCISKATRCARCEEYWSETIVVEGRNLCEECYNMGVYKCNCCGEDSIMRNRTLLPNKRKSKSVCNSCLIKHTTLCQECYTYVHNDRYERHMNEHRRKKAKETKHVAHNTRTNETYSDRWTSFRYIASSFREYANQVPDPENGEGWITTGWTTRTRG